MCGGCVTGEGLVGGLPFATALQQQQQPSLAIPQQVCVRVGGGGGGPVCVRAHVYVLQGMQGLEREYLIRRAWGVGSIVREGFL